MKYFIREIGYTLGDIDGKHFIAMINHFFLENDSEWKSICQYIYCYITQYYSKIKFFFLHVTHLQ